MRGRRVKTESPKEDQNAEKPQITTVRLKVEENQLVDVFGEIGTRFEGLKSA